MSSESTPSLHQQVTLIQGSAIIVIAIYLLTGVVTHDQSRYTLFATIFAKSFVGLLCLSFCYLIYSSGPLLRTIIGYLALLGDH